VNGLAWFWPSITVAFAMSAVLSSGVARLLRIDRGLAQFLVLSIGLVVAATLSPIRAPIGVDLTALRGCDFGRRWLATLPELTSWSPVTLTIAAFLPAGVAIALLPPSIRSAIVALSVAALPVAIEVIHYLVPVLARACKSGNAIDGWAGLGIGLVGGIAVRVGLRLLRRGRRASPA
jgi:hypothetical protein